MQLTEEYRPRLVPVKKDPPKQDPEWVPVAKWESITLPEHIEDGTALEVSAAMTDAVESGAGNLQFTITACWGGDAEDALRIMSDIWHHSGETRSLIKRTAQSGGMLIALACDYRMAYADAVGMLHPVQPLITASWKIAAEQEYGGDFMKSPEWPLMKRASETNRQFFDFVVRQTGLPGEFVARWFSSSRPVLFTAQDMLQLGLIHEIVPGHVHYPIRVTSKARRWHHKTA